MRSATVRWTSVQGTGTDLATAYQRLDLLNT